MPDMKLPLFLKPSMGHGVCMCVCAVFVFRLKKDGHKLSGGPVSPVAPHYDAAWLDFCLLR